MAAVGPTGNIYVLDDAFHKFLPGEMRPSLRTFPFGEPFPQVHAIVPMGGDAVLLQAAAVGAGGAALYHLIGSNGEIRRSFGRASGVQYLVGFAATRRRIADAGGGTFWSISPNRYELTLWDTSGSELARVRRSSRWFENWDERLQLSAPKESPWPTVVQGLQVDEGGLLWILVWAADSSWFGAPSARPPDLFSDTSGTALGRFIDTIVEVVDPVCGVVLARRRFDQPFYGFAARGVTFERSSIDHDSQSSLRVVHLQLTDNSLRRETGLGAGTICHGG